MADAKKEDTRAKKPWIAVGICFALLGLVLATRFVYIPGGPSHANGSDRSSQPTERWLTLNDRDWQGISNFDQQKAIQGHMLTRGVWYLTRCDRNDRLVFTNYPADWKRNSTNNLPPANIYEWMVMPGQSERTAQYVAKIVPRS